MRQRSNKQLEVLDNLADIDPLIDALVSPEHLPGFQIAPETDEFKVVCRAVATSIKRHIPHFKFNERFTKGNNSRIMPDTGWHMDSGFTGVAVHHNMAGNGQVWLQSGIADKSISRAPKRRTEHWLKKHTNGPRLAGELHPGVITVFAELIQTDDIVIPPAFHNFVTDESQIREWERSAYSMSSEVLYETKVDSNGNELLTPVNAIET